MRTEQVRAVIPAMQERCMEMLYRMEHPVMSVRAKNLVKRLLGRSGAKETDPLFWPAGFLLLGLAESAEVTGSLPVRNFVRDYLARWLEKDGRVRHVDDAPAGLAALKLLEQTQGSGPFSGNSGEEAAETARVAGETADRTLRALLKAPRDVEDAILYHPSGENRFVFADGCGMAAMFLNEYLRLSDEWDRGIPAENSPYGGSGGRKVPAELERLRRASDLRDRQLRCYGKHGMDPDTELPVHGYCLQPNGGVQQKGLIGWGRAVGFLAMGGMPGILERALPYQRADGLFSWHLPDREGPTDTSASAMIGCAMVDEYMGTGVVYTSPLYEVIIGSKIEIGASIRGDQLTAAIDRLTDGILAHIRGGRLDGTLAECLDFGQHPQRYGVYPWGMGMGLTFLARVARMGAACYNVNNSFDP